MSKINNTTAYNTETPTFDTLLIGSKIAGGDTRNYRVSDLSAFINLNPSWTTLYVTGNATVDGDTSLNNLTVSGTLGVTGATTMTTLTVSGLTQVGGNLLVTGLLQPANLTVSANRPLFLVGINAAGGTSSLATTAFADNAAAVAGGLSAGDVYRTDGTGAAPLNAAGILMVRV